MTRWEISDFLARHAEKIEQANRLIKEKKLDGVLSAVVDRILGV